MLVTMVAEEDQTQLPLPEPHSQIHAVGEHAGPCRTQTRRRQSGLNEDNAACTAVFALPRSPQFTPDADRDS